MLFNIILCNICLRARQNARRPGCSYGIGKKTEQFVSGVSDLPVAFDYPQIQQSVYWKRHKMFKALGWGTLATGFVTANAGFWWSVSMYEGNYPEKRKKTAGGICYSGLFLIGASIPCFILSHGLQRECYLVCRRWKCYGSFAGRWRLPSTGSGFAN